MKTRLAIVLAAAAALIVTGCGGKGGGNTIKLGMLFNMTGSQASLDAPSANGANLAAKEMNAAGGVLGKQIQLVAFDGKSDAATIGTAATQLAQTDKVRGDVRVQRQRHGDGRGAHRGKGRHRVRHIGGHLAEASRAGA